MCVEDTNDRVGADEFTDAERVGCLTEEQHVDPQIFEVLWCLFCGNRSFVSSRFDGVFCSGCGTSVRLQRWSTGLHAIFGEHTPEFLPPDEDLRRPPETPVFVEIGETDVGYEIDRITPYAAGEVDGWEPKLPTECVEENPDGATTPYLRWGGRDETDDEGDEVNEHAATVEE